MKSIGDDSAKRPTQEELAPAGGSGNEAERSIGRTFNFYIKSINQCLDVILKLSPVFMLGSGLMLWSFLREIGWTHLLLPTTSSPSGLAFLAISAVVFVGAVIVVFLSPSLFLSPGFDLYEGGLTPARVKWILLGLAALWMILFVAIELFDGFAERFAWGCVLIGLYCVGILMYAAPGFFAACKACEERSNKGRREGANDEDTEKLWRAIFRAHWLAPRPEDGAAMVQGGESGFDSQGQAGSAGRKGGRKVPILFQWLRPFLVVFLVLISVLATSSPMLVLIKLWGHQLESNLGTVPALILVLLCAGLAVVPAYVYLHKRSQNVSSAVAAKFASFAASGLVFLSLFVMMYAPIRDRVFHLLEIQSSQEELFLVSSPIAARALGMLEFSLITMPASVAEVSEWAAATKQDATRSPFGTARSQPTASARGIQAADAPQTIEVGTSTKALSMPDPPVIVLAWVGYAFGDTVLLCRWRAGKPEEKREIAIKDGYSLNNVCLPLARSELRRLPDLGSEK